MVTTTSFHKGQPLRNLSIAPPAILHHVDESYALTKPNGPGAEPVPQYLMHRNLTETPLQVISSKGSYIYLGDGRTILDASGGAAVACLGHGNVEVMAAVAEQMGKNTYFNTMHFTSDCQNDLCKEIIQSTDHKMAKVFICSSGSEATEAVLKMSLQYFRELKPPQPQRTRYISRQHSYHGATTGALSISGHLARRKLFEPILHKNTSWVSSCNAYRQRRSSETDADFVAKKALELDEEFQRIGPETVIAFICEPISGAALGCAPYVPGYLAAMKAVCKKYGALFILDEIMCGMGRSGTWHAWQGEHSDAHVSQDCVPDLQTIGKGLGGGYQAIAAVIAGHKVIEAIQNGSGSFSHGQTYQAMPVASAAALTVMRVISRENLLSNVLMQGAYLSSKLHLALDTHPHVGNIRGKGLFWGIEFVRDKTTKEPYAPSVNIVRRLDETSLKEPFNLHFYPGQGTVDGWKGDHIIIAPAYNITTRQVDDIVERVVAIIKVVFEQLEQEEDALAN